MIKQSLPTHTGDDRYAVTLVLSGLGDAYDHVGKGVNFRFRPDHVILIWERKHHGGLFTPWKRKRLYPHHAASRIVGPRVMLKGLSQHHEGYDEVFDADAVGGFLTPYAQSIPGLSEVIAEIESQLP